MFKNIYIWLLIAVVLILAEQNMGASSRQVVAQRVLDQWRELVFRIGQVHLNVPPSYTLAQICQESGGDPTAVGDEGLAHPSTGLLQIRLPALTDYNAAFGGHYSEADLKIPEVNVEVGMGYLSLLITRLGDVNKALEAYNGGTGNIGSAKTVAYRNNVLAFQKIMTGLIYTQPGE